MQTLHRTVWIQGNRMMGAGDHHSNLDVWRYPQGGAAVKILSRPVTLGQLAN
jgi:hypothetical protein